MHGLNSAALAVVHTVSDLKGGLSHEGEAAGCAGELVPSVAHSRIPSLSMCDI